MYTLNGTVLIQISWTFVKMFIPIKSQRRTRRPITVKHAQQAHTLKQCRINVASTSIRRYFDVMCQLGNINNCGTGHYRYFNFWFWIDIDAKIINLHILDSNVLKWASQGHNDPFVLYSLYYTTGNQKWFWYLYFLLFFTEYRKPGVCMYRMVYCGECCIPVFIYAN